MENSHRTPGSMNPYEEKLAQFVEDDVMYQAVKSMLSSEFDMNIQVSLDYTPNSQLVDIVRGVIDGSRRLKKGFEKIDTYRRQKEEVKTHVNPGI